VPSGMEKVSRKPPGTCYWLTGLSGAGKTTIGRAFYGLLSESDDAVVYLDGDILREVFGERTAYDQASRKQLAFTYGRLCRMLTDQGLDVVCATISMFHDVREWNRVNMPRYREVYIDVPMPVLVQRDQKQLYSRALRGEVKDVMGVDLAFEAPQNPDLVLINDGEKSPDQLAAALWEAFHSSIRRD